MHFSFIVSKCCFTAMIDLGADLVKPYTFENQITDQVLELRHGKDIKHFAMDKVSNGPFTDVRCPCSIICCMLISTSARD